MFWLSFGCVFLFLLGVVGPQPNRDTRVNATPLTCHRNTCYQADRVQQLFGTQPPEAASTSAGATKFHEPRPGRTDLEINVSAHFKGSGAFPSSRLDLHRNFEPF